MIDVLTSAQLQMTARALTTVLLDSTAHALVAVVVYGCAKRLLKLRPTLLHTLGTTLLALLPITAVVAFAKALPSKGTELANVIGNGGGFEAAATATAVALPGTEAAMLWPPAWIHIAIAALWLCGCIGLLARTTIGVWWARRLAELGAEDLPRECRERLETLAAEVGVTSAVRFLASSGGTAPFTLGWLRPLVVLPVAMLAGLPSAEVDLIVRHELVHIRRHDYLVNIVQCVTEALFFFNPLVWWLSHQVRLERERACDESVVDAGVSAIAYARALTSLEDIRQLSGSSRPAIAVGATQGDLIMRIRSLITRSTRPVMGPRHKGGHFAAMMIAVASLVAFGACATDITSQQAEDTSQNAGSDTAVAVSVAWLPERITRHRAAIATAARAHAVDADLMALMILIESAGNPNAKSSHGARGLMQLMPQTARGVAQRAGLSVSEDDALYGIPLNLDLAARLLAELTLRYRGQDQALRWTLASYNGGLRAVSRHRDEGAALPDETARYVEVLLQLWAQRHDPRSAAYDALQNRRRARHTAKAAAGAAKTPASTFTSK